MKRLLTISAFAFVAAAAFALVAVTPSVAVAQDNGENAETEQANNKENSEQESSNLSFTAQAGDSYTKIARKSVQIYGINNNVNLSGAQIVAAETYLTSDAGFPELNAGQQVELTNDAVKAAVEKAQGLNEASQALWEKYVKFVNFNTNGVGEASN